MPLSKKEMREYQRQRRAKAKLVKVEVELTSKQKRWLLSLAGKSNDALHKFKRNALLTGAVMRYNAGKPAGDRQSVPKGWLE